jgi:hypothetical protein
MTRTQLVSEQTDDAVGCHTLGTRRTGRAARNERRPR